MDRINLHFLRTLVVGVVVVGSFAAPRAFAYPSMARHGYTTCVTCHYNPSGGGILTPYGKFIAGELLGTFNDSSSALPWLVEPKEDPLFVGTILARGAQTQFDTPQVKRRDLRRMQLDFEGGFVHDGWQLLAAVGPRLDSAIEGKQEKNQIAARRFWAGKVELNYAVRVGKFFPEYGINHYNHNIPTRKGLYFNHNEEPYNIQASYFSETFDYTVAGLKGIEDTQLENKKGYSGTIACKIGTTTRVGVSKIYMSDDETNTGANGVFGQMGYLEKGYVLAEFDIKKKTNARERQTEERVGYFENGWEIYKGINPYVAYEYSNNVTTEAIVKTPEIGLQLHPMTHIEVIMQAGKSYMVIAGEDQTATSGFIMVNLFF